MKEFIVSCDLETTGLNPSYNDWITGSFAVLEADSLKVVRELNLQSRPGRWSEEAFEIHKIRKELAMNFPERKKALLELIGFLPPFRSFDFLCHARPENESGFYHFDFAFLKMDFFDQLSIAIFRQCFDDRDVISTYTMAKELVKAKLLPDDISKGLAGLCAYFKIDLTHHNAESDRRACEALYSHLRRLYGTLGERDSELNSRTSKIPRDLGSQDQQRFSV